MVLLGFLAFVLCFFAIITPFIIGHFHGYIDYYESNDRDLARITAITQEQDLFKTYYEVEVEYLTNTANGVLQNKTIEKDIFYFPYDNKELEIKAKENLYNEVWIISGYKGGYENYKTFGTKLLKDIELKEEL